MPSLTGRNPFVSNRSNVAGSQPTETNRNQPSAQASAPSITLSSPPSLNATQSRPLSQPDFDSTDLEEPPPYTPSASITSGETTVEVGPNRPFQTVQPSANPPRNGVSQVRNQDTHSRIPSSSLSLPLHSSSRPERSTSVVQQLSDSFIDIVNNLNSSLNGLSNSSNYNQGTASQRPTGHSNNWSSYPGQNQRPVPPPLSNPTPRSTNNLAPPPRHPLSSSASFHPHSPTSYPPPSHPPPSHPPPSHPPPSSTSTHSLPSMTNHSSDFARDFYAAGTGSGEALVTEAPPTGPPPSARQAPATQSVPNDGRPTSQPQPGHPLLKDGSLLVYPKGFECRKCHNVGYKDGKPQKPCKRCWKKYAKSFSGPLVYSFPANTASSSLASNFQKPLPYILPSAASASSSSAPTRLARRHPSNHGHGDHNPPTGFMPPPIPPPVIPPPAGNSVTYIAGDPRIGGTLCWRCGGKGSIDMFIFDRETCSLCSGIGRVF